MRLALAALAGAAAVSPGQLLQQIATSPWPASQLPRGMSVKQVGAVPVSAQGKKWHAVGEVGFTIRDPGHADGVVVFEVFPKASDASGDLHHPHLNQGDRRLGVAPGVSASLLIASTTAAGKQVVLGAAVRGTVIVQAIASTNARTVALLKAAIDHLGKLAGLSA